MENKEGVAEQEKYDTLKKSKVNPKQKLNMNVKQFKNKKLFTYLCEVNNNTLFDLNSIMRWRCI